MRLFDIENYYVIFNYINEELKIFCTDFERIWAIIVNVNELLDVSSQINLSIDNYISEILVPTASTDRSISLVVNIVNDNLKMTIFKCQLGTVKINFGEFLLLLTDKKCTLKVIIQLIHDEMLQYKLSNNCLESTVKELNQENQVLQEKYESLSNDVVKRENELLSKVCLVINEKKRKIKELEHDLNYKFKTLKGSNLISSIAGSSLENDEVIDVDESDIKHVDEVESTSDSNAEVPDTLSEDDLFPETINPKLTATPIKKMPDDLIRIRADVAEDLYKDNESSSVPSICQSHCHKSLSDPRISNQVSRDSLKSELFEQM